MLRQLAEFDSGGLGESLVFNDVVAPNCAGDWSVKAALTTLRRVYEF